MSRVEIVFFFFFQAEDGIRDLTVTGVQTCALPISARMVSAYAAYSPTAATSAIVPLIAAPRPAGPLPLLNAPMFASRSPASKRSTPALNGPRPKLARAAATSPSEPAATYAARRFPRQRPCASTSNPSAPATPSACRATSAAPPADARVANAEGARVENCATQGVSPV